MNKIIEISIKFAAVLVITASFAFIFIAIISRFENLIEAEKTAIFQTEKEFDAVCIIGRENYRAPICGNNFIKDGNAYTFHFGIKYCENPYMNFHNPLKRLFGDSIKLVTCNKSRISNASFVSYKDFERDTIRFGVLK